ncbi:MAG: helix-turn-helix domain-containing protein [Oscillospiraceae bacterium]|jgi:transcriptional regulator with XRE-family HTH domain
MYKPINMEMGGRIRAIRKKVGLTSEQLANMMDISIQFLSDVERGKKSFSYENLIKLCRILRVSSDYILLGAEKSDERARLHDVVDSIEEAYLPMMEVAISNTIRVILMAREQTLAEQNAEEQPSK